MSRHSVVAVIVVGLVASLSPGCARLRGEACGCAVGAHGAMYEGQCICHPGVDASEPDAEVSVSFFLDPDVVDGGDGSEARPWQDLDWPAIDEALALGGAVTVFISATEADGQTPETLEQRIDVLRADTGDARLILDGRSKTNTSDEAPSWAEGPGVRARVPGILTPYEGVYSHITVRGFEITGSRDKGVYWRAGDQVILEDLIVHDNGGTPAINLEYSNRSGHRSERFVVRNSHVYNQVGECIYIGGSEGEDEPSHMRIEVVGNLVHDCKDPNGTRNDGINVKDRIGEAIVTHNVVYRTDWGIEVASPGVYAHNIVLDTQREGFQISDAFSPIQDMVFEDNVVVRPGHDGFHINTQQARATGMRLTRNSVYGAGEAGLKVSGEAGMEVTVEDFLTAGGQVGLDGWGEGSADVLSCRSADNEVPAQRNLAEVECGATTSPDLSAPAGPDGLWLTDDDPGWQTGGAIAP